MPRVSKAFFLVAALCGLSGMVWGTHMGISGDHAMAPAHAHLNLLGWVTLSIMGGFYALSPRPGVMPWINFVLSTIGAVMMAVLLPQVLAGRAPGQIMMASEIPAILGMVVFVIAIITSFRQPATT